MKRTTAHTALLLFARTSEEEAHKKWLPNGQRIYAQLNERAKALAHESGLAFFHSSEKDQVGSHFGARFSHALKAIFDQGFTSVISIGNDTPQLTQLDIQNAIAQIRNQNAVIGPSKDGGIYLLGIHASDFDADALNDLKWCSSSVRAQLLKYFRSKGKKVALLRSYQDLDTISDLHVLSNFTRFIPNGILKTLRAAIQQFHLSAYAPEIHHAVVLWQPDHTRGSPC